jgi:hypothetical protein
MSGSKCCISNCKTTSKQGKSLFKFPKGELLERWKSEVSRGGRKKNGQLICENHFESYYLKDVVHANGKVKKVLTPFAYPTIFVETVDPISHEEKDQIGMSDHSNNCRFCLIALDSNEPHSKLTSLLTKQYENLTNSKLRKDKVYSNIACKKCSSDITYFTQLKSKFLKNQEKLHKTFEAFENLTGSKGRRIKGVESEESIEKVEPTEDPTNVKQELNLSVPITANEVKENEFNDDLYDNELEEAYLELDFQESPKNSDPEIVQSQKEEKSTEKEKYPKTLCPDCGLSISKQHLKVHRDRKHLKLKRFECDHCGRQFYLLRGLRDHLKAQHLKKKDVPCSFPDCDKMFPTTSNMKQHYRIKHENKFSAYCELCDRKFTSTELYKIHIRSRHTGERPFVILFIKVCKIRC